MDNQVLSHHGIKDMRWGIRRYQNKDGSLTPAGKKRYNKEVAKAKEQIRIQKNKKKTQDKLDALEALKKKARGEDSETSQTKDKSDTAPKKPTMKSMSDEELMAAINRARLEDTYKSLRPEPVSKGKQFASTLFGQVLAPATVNAGKNFLEKALNKAIDDHFKETDGLAALKKEAEKLKLKNEIKDLKNPKPKSDLPEVKTWKDVLDKQKYDKVNEDRAKEAAKQAAKESASKQTSKDSKDSKDDSAKARQEAYQKQVDDYNANWMKGKSSDRVSSTEYSKSGSDLTDARTVDYGKRTIKGLLSGPSNSGFSANTPVNEVGFVDVGRQATYEVLDRYGNSLAEFYD